MKTIFIPAGLVVCLCLTALAGTPLTESTFTEIIRDAKVVTAATKAVTPALTNTVFRAPDRVRTGPASRVEMTAPDQTITRIGANTIFTFEPEERTILLEKGSILFHSPAGQGGGTIKYRGTAAAVLGTTMLCAVLPDGSFKIMDLEGQVQVTLANGLVMLLKAGQMVIVPPDGKEFREVENFNLEKLVARLVLVVGFSQPLSSMPLIAEAIARQNADIAGGKIDYIVSLDQAEFGLDIVHRLPEPGIPQFLTTPDHTMVPVSPTHP
jgi:hypothetical protein